MNRTKKLTNRTPVPVVGKTSPRPLKSKLSNQRTSFKNQKESKNQELVYKESKLSKELNDCCDMSKPNKKVINLFKGMPYRDLVKHIREEQVQALKMLYFKGWLLSRD